MTELLSINGPPLLDLGRTEKIPLISFCCLFNPTQSPPSSLISYHHTHRVEEV